MTTTSAKMLKNKRIFRVVAGSVARLVAVAGGALCGLDAALAADLALPVGADARAASSPKSAQFSINPAYFLLAISSTALIFVLLNHYMLRRIHPGSRRNELDLLSSLVAAAEFGQDNGVLYLAADRRILSASPMILKLSGLSNDALVGKTVDQAFSSRFARLMLDLMEKSLAARGPAVADILDWSPYTAVRQGPVRVLVSPAINSGTFRGFVIVFRAAAELHLMEDAVHRYQRHYQALFDTLQVGVAVMRITTSPKDGGADAYLVDANAAFKNLFDGISLPYSEPCTEVWPTFTKSKVREVMAQAIAANDVFRHEFFADLLGKQLDVRMVRLSEDRLLVTVVDHTEQRMQEEKVLQLNDQLRRSLAAQGVLMASVLADIDLFNEATADRVGGCLATARQRIGDLYPDSRAGCDPLIDAIQGLFDQLVEYHAVARLPYKETRLVHTEELLQRLIPVIHSAQRGLSFELRQLPAMVASPTVLEEIVKRLLMRVARLPNQGAARVEVGRFSDFLQAGLCLSGWGLDTAEVFLEVPEEPRPLDWLLSGDLELATVRRMVTSHGGELLLGKTDDGEGFRVILTVGTPVS